MAVQRDEAWLATATAEEIAAAYDAGELDAIQGRMVLSGPDIGSVPGLQRDQAWVDTATPERIAAAMAVGELDAYLGRIPWPGSNPEKPPQGLYGDGTIVTHDAIPAPAQPRVTGPATTIDVGVPPKDA